MPQDDVTIRMRSRGGRQTARDVDQVARSTRNIDESGRRATKSMGMFGRTGNRAVGLLKRPFRALKDEALGLAKHIIGIGLAFGTWEGIHRSIETTDQLVKTTVKLRNQFGLTTQAASGLAGVLQARDIQPQALIMGLTSLSKQLVAAEHGNKTAQGGFRLLGIRMGEVHQAVGSPNGLNRVFAEVTDRMTKMHGSARKGALGQQLLGRASRGLAPLLQEGALGLQQQLKWAREYGVTLDGKTIGSVESMAAAQTQAQYASLGLQIQLGRFLAPALTRLNIVFANTIRSFREGRPEGDKYSRTLYQVGMDLKPVGHGLLVVGKYLKDHPRLLRLAAVGFIAYRLKLLKLIGIAPKAYVQGLIAGRAFARGYQTGAGGSAAPYQMVGRTAGRWFAYGFVAIAGVYIINELRKQLQQGMANAFGAITDDLFTASPRDPTVRKGERLIHSHGFRRHEGAYFKRYPADRARTYRLNQRDIATLLRHGYPGLIPGAPGVPRDYHPGHPYVLESHTTVNLDGKVVAKKVHRQAVKRKSVR